MGAAAQKYGSADISVHGRGFQLPLHPMSWESASGIVLCYRLTVPRVPHVDFPG